MPSLNIRLADINDIDAVVHLFNLYRSFYKKATDISAAHAYVRARISNQESVIFLAETESHEAAGFVQLYPGFSSLNMSRTWILNDLYVIDGHRRNGVARQLIEAAHSYAASTGATSISLETQIENKKAQELYEKAGFTLEKGFLTYSRSLKN